MELAEASISEIEELVNSDGEAAESLIQSAKNVVERLQHEADTAQPDEVDESEQIAKESEEDESNSEEK